MTTFSEGLRQGLKNAYCSQVASSPQWFTNLRRVLVPGALRDAADNLYTWICDIPQGDAPPPPPPQFEGGQCPGVTYNATAIRISSNGNGPPSDPPCQYTNDGRILVATGLTGPISGVGSEVISAGSPNVFTRRWFITHAGGEFNLGGFFTGCPEAGFFGFEFNRADGLPDDCGDPGPDIPDETDPIEVSVTIIYGDDNEYSLTVPVIFAPVYVALDGTVNVPVSIGEINLNGTLELFPDFNFNPEFTFTGPDPGPEGDPVPETPDIPDGTDGGEDDEPPEPESSVIGVFVDCAIQSSGKPSGIYREIGPDIYAPRLGTVKFAVRFGGRLFWSEDLPIKTLRGYIPNPFQFNAERVVCNAEPGVFINWSEVRSAVPDWPPYLEIREGGSSDNTN
jgi:hypothetical protein